MSTKRFGMIKSKFTGMYVPVDNQHVYNFCGFEDEFTCMGFVNALNALQQRGTENGKIATQLLEENEELKNRLNELLTDNTKQKKVLNNCMKENKELKQQKPFLKIIDDYFIKYGDDGELFSMHKPSDIRSLMHILNREHGYNELQCEYNDKDMK